MTRFEEYESSQITTQNTLLQKFTKLLEYLRANPSYKILRSSENYTINNNRYEVDSIETDSQIDKGDIIIFANAYVGTVDAVGTNYIFVNSATALKDEITPQRLMEVLTGTEEIIVDINETNDKVEFHLDNNVSNKINKALQLPVNPPATEKIVAIGTNGAQKLIDFPSDSGEITHITIDDTYFNGWSYEITLNEGKYLLTLGVISSPDSPLSIKTNDKIIWLNPGNFSFGVYEVGYGNEYGTYINNYSVTEIDGYGMSVYYKNGLLITEKGSREG